MTKFRKNLRVYRERNVRPDRRSNRMELALAFLAGAFVVALLTLVTRDLMERVP